MSALLDVAGQGIETSFPELPVVFQPAVDGAQRPGFERALVHSPVDRPRDEPGLLENPDVSGDRGQRHGERLRQLGDLGGRLRQPGEQSAPGSIAQRVEDRIQAIVARVSCLGGA